MSKSAFGLSLEISDNSSTGFQAIGELEDINVPVIEADQIDVTVHDVAVTSVPNQITVSGFTGGSSYANGTYTKLSSLLNGKHVFVTGGNLINYTGSQWNINDNQVPGTFAINLADTDVPPKSGWTLAGSFDGVAPAGTPALSYTDITTPAEDKRLSIKGLVDNGEISLTINYDPATPPTISSTSNTNLYSHIQQIDSTLYFKVKQGGSTQMSFKGLLVGVEQGTAIDNVVKMTLNVKVTEQITY